MSSVYLTNNDAETKTVFSDSFLEISRSDSKGVYAYPAQLFSFLPGEVSQEHGSQTVTLSTKIVCVRSFDYLPSGIYFKKTIVTDGRETDAYYSNSGTKITNANALTVLQGNQCIKGRPQKETQQPSRDWRDWPSDSTIHVKLTGNAAEAALNQPWIAENDARIKVDSIEFGVHEEAQLKVLSNNYRGSGVFSLCEGDSVAIGGMSFQANDFSEGGVRLEEKKSGEQILLVSQNPEASLKSVNIKLIKSKHVSGKSTNPFQAEVKFSLEGKPQSTEAISNPEPAEQTSPEATPTPVERKRVAGTEVRCRKKIVVPYRLVLPFLSPCPNGFTTESAENFGGVVVFYRRATCVQEYAVCSAKPSCGLGDETFESAGSPCFYDAPLAETGKTANDN